MAHQQRTVAWESAQPLLEDAGLEVARVEREGSPGKALTAYSAEIDAELLVVGTRGLGWVKKLLLGSTAQDVIHNGTCDVLLVR
jgi:nucleotide-binding universal stress UspA family protein